MSNNQIARSRPFNDNLTAIFNAALAEYRVVTGQPLESDPSAVELATCNSPGDILSVLETQVKALAEFRRGLLERFVAQLNPTVNVLLMLTATLGDAVGVVSRTRRSFGIPIL